MQQNLQPVDYLAIGHIAVDLTPNGKQLGGTVSYSARMAQAMGLKVGMITSVAEDVKLENLNGIQIVNIPTQQSTTFENVKTEHGRKQTLHYHATKILAEHVPDVWKNSAIVHLAPIAQEVDLNVTQCFGSVSFIGVTPQGWMRGWDENGRVYATAWENSNQVLGQIRGVVLSLEDLNHDLEKVEWLASQINLLCVTEGEAGCVLHWRGDRRRFRPITVEEVDATGAGDIFAAAFFVRLHQTKDAWEAARFATNLAAYSVTRVGMFGIPTLEEIEYCKMEVLS
jgi:sugar/nucleoside kinase (ribokinase family)